jgi:3-oxoacyl-[acyl-carrier protein] reductase
VDVVVCNVGSGVSVPDAIPDPDHFDATMKTNFASSVITAHAFLPLLERAQGAILFVSSIAGLEAIGAPTDYAAAKAALGAFAKNLARKVASGGVRVNCVAPGNILFDGGSWDRKLADNPTRVRTLIDDTVPMKRFGTPAEIAAACAFLCSDAASFVTGATLVVDGGQTVAVT